MKIRFLSCLLILIACAGLNVAQTPPQPTPTPKAPSAQIKQVETWWQKILRYAGLTATPTRQRGPSNEASSGNVWIYNLERRSGRRLTVGGDYVSPIFIVRDEYILALKGDDIVQIPISGGSERVLGKRGAIFRLIGVSVDSPETILALAKTDNVLSIVTVSLKDLSTVTIPYETESEEGQSAFAQLVGWNRVYCNTEIYVQEQCTKNASGGCATDQLGRTIKWTDVMFKRAYKEPVNISKCERDNCGQPSLSEDGQTVTYVRSPNN